MSEVVSQEEIIRQRREKRRKLMEKLNFEQINVDSGHASANGDDVGGLKMVGSDLGPTGPETAYGRHQSDQRSGAKGTQRELNGLNAVSNSGSSRDVSRTSGLNRDSSEPNVAASGSSGSNAVASSGTGAPESETLGHDPESDSEPDMFASSDSESESGPLTGKKLDQSLLDSWDDVDGYYRLISGELLDGRYSVTASLGKGMFASVVRASDAGTSEPTPRPSATPHSNSGSNSGLSASSDSGLSSDSGMSSGFSTGPGSASSSDSSVPPPSPLTMPKQVVAIKIIRNNETMAKAALHEISILERLNSADPSDRHGVVRLLRHFNHKNHVCLVFESLNSNLRDVLKKYGRDVGISIDAIRVYAGQMLRALALLKRCNILHADLKPDNMLVNDSHNVVKLADFGSALVLEPDNPADLTPYVMSRYYRAPELILGFPYDYPIDMWSMGCSLFEMYSGRVLFPGKSNNDLLRLIMQAKGKFPHKMLKRGQFASRHFDGQLNLQALQTDKTTGRQVMKTILDVGPFSSHTIKARLLPDTNLPPSQRVVITQFIDLVELMTTLNPDKRITPEAALAHHFFTA